tara:strand:+ start:351 stop:815 length:465 start_codon:yes stop_codon:yes gene_type:complete
MKTIKTAIYKQSQTYLNIPMTVLRKHFKPEMLPILDKIVEGWGDDPFEDLDILVEAKGWWEKGSEGGMYEPPTPQGYDDIEIGSLKADGFQEYFDQAGINDLSSFLNLAGEEYIREYIREVADAPEGPDPDYLRDQMMDDRAMDRAMDQYEDRY